MNDNSVFGAYAVGPTLYMPVIHPKVPDTLLGFSVPPSRTMVLCLEDALACADVERGLKCLTDLLAKPLATQHGRFNVFVRPRSYDMACRLRELPGIHQISGFVVPKARIENLTEWTSLTTGTSLRLMPTIETPEYFDPGRLAALRDILLASGLDRIAAVRLGGNDLLGSMGLRRVRGVTAYEGPLAWFLSMATSLLIPPGIPLAAPVFDVIDDVATLEREVQRDIEMGFISKTAIHPSQVSAIMSAMAVDFMDLVAARKILEPGAPAVFRLNNVMCEPSTHTRWAQRILARADHYGVREAPFKQDFETAADASTPFCVSPCVAQQAHATHSLV